MNKKTTKQNILSLISHIGVFVLIEILFVFVILHEFPEISLFEKIGIVHVSYWIILLIAGFVREKLKRFWQKFVATYLPVVYHIAGHIYVGISTVEIMDQHHEEHNMFWMIVATIALGIVIFVGEWLLHKKYHCDTCHVQVHKHCKDC